MTTKEAAGPTRREVARWRLRRIFRLRHFGSAARELWRSWRLRRLFRLRCEKTRRRVRAAMGGRPPLPRRCGRHSRQRRRRQECRPRQRSPPPPARRGSRCRPPPAMRAVPPDRSTVAWTPPGGDPRQRLKRNLGMHFVHTLVLRGHALDREDLPREGEALLAEPPAGPCTRSVVRGCPIRRREDGAGWHRKDGGRAPPQHGARCDIGRAPLGGRGRVADRHIHADHGRVTRCADAVGEAGMQRCRRERAVRQSDEHPAARTAVDTDHDRHVRHAGTGAEAEHSPHAIRSACTTGAAAERQVSRSISWARRRSRRRALATKRRRLPNASTTSSVASATTQPRQVTRRGRSTGGRRESCIAHRGRITIPSSL